MRILEIDDAQQHPEGHVNIKAHIGARKTEFALSFASMRKLRELFDFWRRHHTGAWPVVVRYGVFVVEDGVRYHPIAWCSDLKAARSIAAHTPPPSGTLQVFALSTEGRPVKIGDDDAAVIKQFG